MYQVQVEFAPAYELASSLVAYVDTRTRRILELGQAWRERVRRGLGGELIKRLEAVNPKCASALHLLVWQCPGPRDAASFVGWLESLTVGEVYERLAPHLPEGEPLPADLPTQWPRLVEAARAWQQRYFAGLDRAILDCLAADAVARRLTQAAVSPVELVEAASGGVVIEPVPGLQRVVLVPQYHWRPWNVYSFLKGWLLDLYPVDLPSKPGEPHAGLLRFARALSEPNRLRILRYLGQGERSFTDVQRFCGVAKSTVHYHLVVLRAAGLLRCRIDPTRKAGDRYSLRGGALEHLSDRLTAFVTGKEE